MSPVALAMIHQDTYDNLEYVGAVFPRRYDPMIFEKLVSGIEFGE
jgi:hypothetical protein